MEGRLEMVLVKLEFVFDFLHAQLRLFRERHVLYFGEKGLNSALELRICFIGQKVALKFIIGREQAKDSVLDFEKLTNFILSISSKLHYSRPSKEGFRCYFGA